MPSSVTTHKKQSHPDGPKPWPCDYCEARFVSQSHLELHRRTHTGEKPWVCDVCGQGFAQKRNMVNHKQEHSGKGYDFHCETCGQQFKSKLQLERHMMDHTGIRPYPCDQCSQAFKCSNSLKSHKMSVHSDVKHFVCQHCGSGFSTSSGVSRHQKNNRCSGLKAGAASNSARPAPQLASPRKGGKGGEVGGKVGEGRLYPHNTPVAPPSNQVQELERMQQSTMQYLHNIASLSHGSVAQYPLSLAMGGRGGGEQERGGAQHGLHHH